MDCKTVLGELQKRGTAQNRKVYARHGVGECMFGVSYADLKKMTRTYRGKHELALALWASGNHDARILATMIADPERATVSLLNEWVKDLDNYITTDAFSTFVGNTPHVSKKMEQWMKSPKEWVATAGWNLLGGLAVRDESLPDTFFKPYLKIVRGTIHQQKNRVRHSMNHALICIGVRSQGLHKLAVSVAKKVGKVEVNHGKTSCKTPDAIAYMEKTLTHRARKTR